MNNAVTMTATFLAYFPFYGETSEALETGMLSVGLPTSSSELTDFHKTKYEHSATSRYLTILLKFLPQQ